MTTKELIREKIDSFYAEYKAKFHQNGEPYNLGIIDGLDMAERILDTLEEPVGKTCKTCGFYENNCPFIRGKFISYPNKVCKDYTFSTLKAEQEPVSEDLEEAAEKYAEDEMMAGLAERAFKAGAEWMKKQIPMPEDTVIFQKGVEEGRRLEREDVKSIIQSRIDEILGDAQPNPILRMELQELIKKIEL